jgi:hypothetical protein
MIQRLLPPILVGLALVFAFSSCSKHNDSSAANVRARAYASSISLDSVSSQGCLNAEELFRRVEGIDPSRSAVVVPTAIDFSSENGVPEGFRQLIAVGQLNVTRESMAQAQSLPEAQQADCKKLTLYGTDGEPKAFDVKTSKQDSLTAQAEDGESYELTWLTPQRYQSKHRYPVLDQPCSSGDKPVFVTVTKVTDWSDAGVPDQVPATGSVFSIEAGFISLAATAVGASADDVYVGDPAGTGRSIDFGKVNALTAKTPKPETLSCGGVADPVPGPTPDPNPNPNPNPDDPLNPDHPHHGNDGGDLPRR